MKPALSISLGLVVAGLLGSAAYLYTPDKSRASLEAAYGVASTDYVLVDGMRLHVRDTGPRTAPPIIFLHGFGSNLLTWEPWAKALSRDYRVIRYDQPGFGLTGPDPTGDYTERRGMAVLAALMDHLGLARATIVGNSMGGKLAWNFAAAYPARVDKLVLISPDGYASPGFEYGKKPTVPLMVKLLPYVLPARLLRATLAPAYGDPGMMSDALVAQYRDMMLVPGVRRAIIERMEQVTIEDPTPLLRTIQAPTLILWGEKDAMIPFSNSADYLAAIPHATLASFPTLGHVPFEEAPEESLVPLRAFLANGG